MALPPLTEGGGVNLHDGTLDERLGADQLIVRGVVDNVDEARLAGDGFASPAKVAALQTQRTVLVVAATDADQVDALRGGQLGVGGGATQLKLALLAVVGALGSRRRALMAAVTTDAYPPQLLVHLESAEEPQSPSPAMDGWGRGGTARLTHCELEQQDQGGPHTRPSAYHSGLGGGPVVVGIIRGAV